MENFSATGDKKERTSSSRSGRHVGLYKSIAHDDDLSGVFCTTVTIVLAQGRPTERMKQIIDFPLEKIPGYPASHKLRIIQLLEADLNFIVAIIWGDRLAQLIAKHDVRNPAQSAYYWKKDTGRCGLSKLICSDIARQNQATMWRVEQDSTAAFDNITAEGQEMDTQREGCPAGPTHLLTEVIRTLVHTVQTAFGKSKATYTSCVEGIVDGSGQGGGCAPFAYSAVVDHHLDTLDDLCNAHAKVYHAAARAEEIRPTEMHLDIFADDEEQKAIENLVRSRYEGDYHTEEYW